jgi:hypothetical protein
MVNSICLKHGFKMVQGQTYVEDFLGFIKGRLHLELTELTLDSSGFGIPMDSARRNDDGHPHLH